MGGSSPPIGGNDLTRVWLFRHLSCDEGGSVPPCVTTDVMGVRNASPFVGSDLTGVEQPLPSVAGGATCVCHAPPFLSYKYQGFKAKGIHSRMNRREDEDEFLERALVSVSESVDEFREKKKFPRTCSEVEDFRSESRSAKTSHHTFLLLITMPSRHTRLWGGRPWGFSSSAGPSNNPYGNNDCSSDNSVIPSEHVWRMLEWSESESFMATSPSVTSVESIPTREMEGSDNFVEIDPSKDLDEFEDDDVETSAEFDEVVPLVALGGNFENVPITDFVVLSDDSDGDSSEESEEQMATGYLFGDSDIDEPMWEGPDGVLYEFNSDDSWQPGVHANLYYYPPTPDSLLTLDSFSSMSLGTDFGVSDAPLEGNALRDSDCVVFIPTEYGIPRQALASNMVSPDIEFATPPSPLTLNFVEILSDNELSDADELDGVPFSNYMKSEMPSKMPRMSISARRFASRTWYDGHDGANSKMFHMCSGNKEVDEEVLDPTFECKTLPETPPSVEEPGVLFLRMNGHYPRACPYVRHYHPYARPYVICYGCGDEGHYATVYPRKRPENPGPSSPSPSTSAKKKKKNLSIN
ncbi:hypothetical protein ISN44_As13g009840 [Arabidopsis suecica]|uniref:Uncharacterized protein n=1 Tax=Arabidopsis suecica TaxID=45249 RepID=A0A8T1XWW4_ARASU|nr:hypothetical protein ISN44_As13g009840 [Arabidopsis suecica]